MGRGILLVGMLLVAVLTASPASAADPTPSPDPLAPAALPPSVSPPSQQQIDDAKAAMKRLRNPGTANTPALTRVAGPTTPERDSAFHLSLSDQGWWVIGAGLLVLLVASETTRVSVRRAKHRKHA